MSSLWRETAVCPIFIGRQQDLTLLHMLVDRMIGGQGQIVLVSGEAGIGKSRLIVEAKTHAVAADVHIFQGNCFATDQSFPYAPLLDLFRAYFVPPARIPVADDMHPFLAELAPLLPDLVLHYPGLANQPLSRLSDLAQEKRRFFATLAHFFLSQAACHPVLLVIEDAHWCDDLSLDFLLHLARQIAHVPLLLIVSYRSDALQPALRRWLAQVDRERLAQELPLKRLSQSDVAAMLRAMLGPAQEIDADLIDALYTRSEGNPFFVEELLKLLITTEELVNIEGSWKQASYQVSVPRSVQETVQQRVIYLSQDAKRLLTLAAVAGRRFDVTLLREVIESDEAHLLDLLKEAVAAQLVVEEASDRFAFRHALTQQAIIASLLIRERQSLHHTIAQTLERLATSAPLRERYLEDLAYHCYEAGIWGRALEYAQEAGERALALFAQQPAIAHFTRAIEAAHRLDQVPPARLYLARGQSYEMLGSFDRACGDYEQALDAARSSHDGEREWEGLLALGFLWTGHDYEQAGVWFRRALALAEEHDNPTLRARSLNRLGNWLQNTGRTAEALVAHQEALRLFELQADRLGMAQTLGELGMAHFFLGDPARAVQDFFLRAMEMFRNLDDRQNLFSLLAARAMDSAPETIETTFSALRTCAECVQDVEEALRLAHQINSQAGQAFVEMAAAIVWASFGKFGPALTHAHEALDIATAIDHQEWIAAAHGALGQIYLLLLDSERAIASLETALAEAQASNSAIWIKQLTPYLALAYLHRREFLRSAAALSSIMTRDQQPGNFFERQAARVWGELALARGEPAAALIIAGSLLKSAPGNWQQPIPHLLALKGEALLAMKRLDEAAETLEQAKLGAEMRQAPSILWRIQRSLGKVYHLLKREEQAQREFAAARYGIQELAATIDDPSLRQHYLHNALGLLPGAKPLSRTVARHAFGGLTPREREVATLVAQGKTSREIADLLVVSERTAEVHVSHILGKLGFTSRTQIAAWVVETGLSKR